MKPTKDSELPAVRKIVERIVKVRRAASVAAESKHRFAEYKYLKSVLRAHNYFVENDLIQSLAEIAPSVLLVAPRAGSHPLRVVIDATCIQPNLRMRSRWARALEYALANRIGPDDLPRFLRANNGIAGCADSASKVRPKRQGADSKSEKHAPKSPAISIESSPMERNRPVTIRSNRPFLTRDGIIYD